MNRIRIVPKRTHDNPSVAYFIIIEDASGSKHLDYWYNWPGIYMTKKSARNKINSILQRKENDTKRIRGTA